MHEESTISTSRNVAYLRFGSLNFIVNKDIFSKFCNIWSRSGSFYILNSCVFSPCLGYTGIDLISQKFRRCSNFWFIWLQFVKRLKWIGRSPSCDELIHLRLGPLYISVVKRKILEILKGWRKYDVITILNELLGRSPLDVILFIGKVRFIAVSIGFQVRFGSIYVLNI
jgi:hypothetical protein